MGYVKIALVVTVAIVTTVSSSSNTGVQKSTWQLLPSSTAVVMTVALETRSKVECAAACSGESVPCVTFCKSANTNTCYLAVEMASPVNILPNDVSIKCYRKGPCSSLNTEYSDYGGRCLKYSAVRKDYASASAQCQSDGGHLFHYKSLAWDKPAAQELLQGVTSSATWVGADRLAVEGNWQWTDGTPLSPVADTWMSGEPNNDEGSEYCAHLWLSVLRINDETCTRVFPYICQIDL
ncbi:hypothetical protein BaRGS_00009242 [Batillaria attramentaria]|uniref:C-type lectin domain-containing protein n=1 Tax=Batillaria attramentaria TaxID=370345 RepID=A0ABD0LJK9_9CAEN